MKVSKEVKVGLLAFVSIVILYFGFNYLKGIAYFSPEKTYYVVYQNVGGLKVSNPVVLNGFSVGRVRSIDILHDRNNRLLVGIDVDKSIRLTQQSEAVLSSSALLGDKTIVLNINDATASPVMPGDTLDGKVEKGLKETIMESTKPIVERFDSTIFKINRIFDDTTSRHIKNAVRNVDKGTKEFYKMLQENRKSVATISRNAQEMSKKLSKTMENVQPMVKKMNRFADSLSKLKLNKTVAKANTTLDNLNKIVSRIDSGKGSLGKLTKNEELYDNLNKAAKNLDTLLNDLNDNPKRYVHFSIFGRKNKD